MGKDDLERFENEFVDKMMMKKVHPREGEGLKTVKIFLINTFSNFIEFFLLILKKETR